jgi:hypothetical protein
VKEDSLHVKEDATLGNGHSLQRIVQLLIVADSELKVAWDDVFLLLTLSALPATSTIPTARYSLYPFTDSNPLGVGVTLQQTMHPPDW